MPSIKPSARVQAQLETILVASDATEQTGALVTATTALNLDNGAIGILSTDLDGSPAGGNFVTAANVGASTNTSVQLVQGTPLSSQTQKANPFEVKDKALVKSDVIHKSLVRSTKTVPFTSGVYNAVQVTGIPTPAVDKTYSAYVRALSVKNDKEFGDNDDVVYGSYTTPSSLTGITNTTDKVLQELAADLNLRSKATIGNKNFVVLGLKIAGGAGTALGGISTAGTSIPVMTHEGITYSITSDAAMVRMLVDQIGASSLTAATTIETIDVLTAGDAAKIDALLFVALNEDEAAIDDDIMSQYVVLDVNLADDLTNTSTMTTTKAVPASGTGRHWRIFNERRAQLRTFTMQNHPHGEVFSQGANYVDETKNYGAFIVEFYDYEETLTNRSVAEKKAIVLYPQTEDTETVTSAVANVGLSAPAVGITDTVDISAIISTFTSWVG